MAVTINGNGSVTGLSNEITNVVLEEFFYPCNGATVTTSAGDITLQNVTDKQLATDSYVDVTGSTIAYTPPAGTKTVIYKFHFQHSRGTASTLHIANFKFFVDSDEVVHSRTEITGERLLDLVSFEWPIRIGGTANTDTGRVASWSSNKTLKMQFREYSSSYDAQIHKTYWWDGTESQQLSVPRIGITALSI
jgi:hypothetical protein